MFKSAGSFIRDKELHILFVCGKRKASQRIPDCPCHIGLSSGGGRRLILEVKESNWWVIYLSFSSRYLSRIGRSIFRHSRSVESGSANVLDDFSWNSA